MAKHTPGPWEAIIGDGTYFPSVQIGRMPIKIGERPRNTIAVNCGPSPDMVANGEYIGTTTETANANARLIAAAPDMLEALKEAKIALSRVGGPQFGRLGKDKHVPELIRAAISKAEGTE